MKIQIMGASGAGKTFLGNELAKVLNFVHVDTDDILWVWKDGVQPFTVPVPGEEGYKIFKEIFNDNENLITTGFFYPWGERLIKDVDLLIYVTTSTEIRKERIIKREYELFGDRVDGDMKEHFSDFLNWACSYDSHNDKNGSKVQSERWIEKYNCPVLYLNGSNDINNNIEMILKAIEINNTLSQDDNNKTKKLVKTIL